MGYCLFHSLYSNQGVTENKHSQMLLIVLWIEKYLSEFYKFDSVFIGQMDIDRYKGIFSWFYDSIYLSYIKNCLSCDGFEIWF